MNKQRAPPIHSFSYPHADADRWRLPHRLVAAGLTEAAPAGVEQTPAVLASVASEGRQAAEGARVRNLSHPTSAPTSLPAIPTPLDGFCIATAHPIHGRLVRPAGHPIDGGPSATEVDEGPTPAMRWTYPGELLAGSSVPFLP
jgi:hypothetical protein